MENTYPIKTTSSFNKSETNVEYFSPDPVNNMTAINNSFDEEAYLAVLLGNRYMDLHSSVILTIIYTVIFLTGTIGNICTCIVIACNRNMHTATNYYLVSLAVSDLCTLVLALPPELYGFWESYPWRFGIIFCIIKSFISEMTAYASVLTITAFTIERYAAICHPMRFQRLSSPSRSVKVIIFIWALACLFALPYPIHARTFHAVKYPNSTEEIKNSLVCNIPSEWRQEMTYMFQVSTFVFFALPMVVITVMYVLIGVTLYKSEVVGDNKNPPKIQTWTSSTRNGQSINGNPKVYSVTHARKAVLKMLVAVVIAFFACWAPFHSQRLMTIYIEVWTSELHTIQTYLFYISGILYFFNSTINPILYNLMSKKFQKAFRKTICRCRKRGDLDLTSSFGGSQSPYREKTLQYTYSRINKASPDKLSALPEPETATADLSV